MSRRLATGWAVAALLAVASLCPTAAVASLPPPSNLVVAGGEESWHPRNDFRLGWDNPSSGPEIAARHYLIRDESGRVVQGDTRLEGALELIDGIRVPGPPGVYTAEVWLEGKWGFPSAPASARLRFDNVRPGDVEPLPPPAWIGRASFPLTLRIGQPTEAPVSGIRGYALSIDSASHADPCAAADRCTGDETDLHGGALDNSITIAGLPEGTRYLHAVAVSGSGIRSTATGHAALNVDLTYPVTRLGGAPSGWTNRPVALTATATDTGSGMDPAEPGAKTFTALAIDERPPTIEPGALTTATVIGEGVHTIAYYARDAAGNVDDGTASNAVANPRPSTARVRIDRSPPRVAFAATPEPGDLEVIRVRVSDPLSGADPSRGWVGVRRAGSGDRFESLSTTAASGGLRARWKSDTYPAGEYEFQATGYDAAGNATTTGHRVDGKRMLLPNPLKTSTSLGAGFGGRVLVWHRCVRRGARRHCRSQKVRGFSRRPARRMVPFGRGVRFSGRLHAGRATPLERVPVQVVEHFAAGSRLRERVSIVRTGVGGRFSVRLAPGPSREVTAVFRGARSLARSASRTVRLGVRGGVRLHTSSPVARIGGRAIVFDGKVLYPRGGKQPAGQSVQLQFRLPGLPWREFRTVKTDSRGRFRYAYRFSDDDSRGVRFLFRASAPAQGGWPFEPGRSRPISVRGM